MARRHVLRELIADPGPMGLFAFGTITLVVGTVKTGWYTDVNVGALNIAFWWGGLGQVIAGILDLLRGSGVTGGTFTAFGLHWMLQGAQMQQGTALTGAYADVTEYEKLQGVYFFCFFLIAVGATVGLSRVSWTHIALLCIVDVIFLFDAVHCWKHTPQLNKTTGYLCVIAALMAFYLGLVAQWEDSNDIRLPIGRRSPPPAAIEARRTGDFDKYMPGDKDADV